TKGHGRSLRRRHRRFCASRRDPSARLPSPVVAPVTVSALMMLDSDHFRSVLGRFASGVTVVTAVDGNGANHGMTVSAFCSVSLSPPLVLVCIDNGTVMSDVVASATHFAVNLLSASQEAVSRRFADTRASERFLGVGFTPGASGVAL